MTLNLRMKCRALLLVASAVAAVGSLSTAVADPMFFSSRSTVLYRFNLTDPPQTFDMADRFAAMATDSSGVIWLCGRLNPDHDEFIELYTLEDPCGTPTLKLESDFLPRPLDSMSFIGSTLYGTFLDNDSPHSNLIAIDIVNQTYHLVGATGDIGDRAESSGYDPDTQILYGIDNSETPNLKIIDWQLLNGTDPTVTIVGPTGQPSWTSGGDFYDGQYYHLVSQANFTTGGFDITLGAINLATGAFTAVRSVDAAAPAGTIGLAIIDIPEGASCPITGACCFSGEGCELLSEAACNNLEGAYLGNDVPCDADSDGDQVADCNDHCPGTAEGDVVDAVGCSCDQIVDETPPVFNFCPEDHEWFIEGCSTELGEYRFGKGPIAHDNSEPTCDLTLTQEPPAGTVIGPGDTHVVITATDEHENSATCEFTLTILVNPCLCGLDETPPVIESCPESPEPLQAGVDCTAPAPDLTGDVIAFDNCVIPSQENPDNNNNNNNNNSSTTQPTERGAEPSGLTVTQEPLPGTPLTVGEHVITMTVTDPSNNQATCEVSVTVLQGECVGECGENDHVPPQMEGCPSAEELSSGTECFVELGDYTRRVKYSDNCSEGESLTIEQQPPAGTLLGPGAHEIALIVRDANENVASCTFIVTVTGAPECACGEGDTLAPVIETCPANRTLLADTACHAEVPDLTGEVVASDNCPISESGLTITQSPEAGTIIGAGETIVTLTVTDANGNEATCDVTLTIDPNGCNSNTPNENNNNNNNNNDNGNENTNTNTNVNQNDNTGGGEPEPQPAPCDPATDSSLNILFSLLFHAPVCGTGCPLMVIGTLCGFLALRTRRRRHARSRQE